MKFSSTLILAVAGLVSSTPIAEESAVVSKRASNPSVVGTKISIEGSTNYFVGANSNWVSYLLDDAEIDTTFAHLQASGVKAFRVWGPLAIFSCDSDYGGC